MDPTELNRYQYYSFLRQRRKPQKGEIKVIKFPPIGDDEDVTAYYERCHEEVGAIPSPIIPNQKKGKKWKNQKL